MAMINGEEMEGEFDRGRMYERYREKREAKLREEWCNRMEQKEAQIRAVWQQLGESWPVGNTQEISKSTQEEGKTHATISRKNSFKTLDKSTTGTISPSRSRPQTRHGNRGQVPRDAISNLSTLSSPRNLSRSRTVNTESNENRLIRISHQRRNTLTNLETLEFANNSHSDSSKNGRISKPFLKKGTGIGPGSGPLIAKQRARIKKEEINTDYSFDSFESGDNLSSSMEPLDSGSESVDFVANNGVLCRERKKWVAPEKLDIFSSQHEKEEGKGFKRLLLNIIGKSKNRDRLEHDSSMF